MVDATLEPAYATVAQTLAAAAGSSVAEKIADSDSKYSWPQDVELYQPTEIDRILLPEKASCLAVRAYLQMCKLPYKLVDCPNAKAMSPRGRLTKLPFLRIEGALVPEFEPIVDCVDARGHGLSKWANESIKFDMRSLVTYVENTFTLAELYVCFMNKHVYDELVATLCDSMYSWPFNLLENHAKRNTILNILQVYQWHDISLDEVVERLDCCCCHLTHKLDRYHQLPYFYGELPCELDAIVFGHVHAILTTELPNMVLSHVIGKYQRLLDLCASVSKMLFK